MKKIIFLLIDFLPFFVFLIIENFWGDKEALIASICMTFLVFTYYKLRKESISRLFYFIFIITIVFAGIDLLSEGKPTLIKYEPVITNCLTALIFLLSVKNDNSIIQDFAIKQGHFSENDLDEGMVRFFKIWTIIWVLYFFFKSVGYLWLAKEYSYKDTLWVRMLLGSLTFYVLLLASVFGGRISYIIFKKIGLLPSSSKKYD